MRNPQISRKRREQYGTPARTSAPGRPRRCRSRQRRSAGAPAPGAPPAAPAPRGPRRPSYLSPGAGLRGGQGGRIAVPRRAETPWAPSRNENKTTSHPKRCVTLPWTPQPIPKRPREIACSHESFSSHYISRSAPATSRPPARSGPVPAPTFALVRSCSTATRPSRSSASRVCVAACDSARAAALALRCSRSRDT